MKNILLKIRKRGLSVNYFTNLGAGCYFPKLECSESSSPKNRDVSVIYPNLNCYINIILYCMIKIEPALVPSGLNKK